MLKFIIPTSLSIIGGLIYYYRSSRKQKLIYVEGNIGSGKSSLLKMIENKIKDSKLVYEPVNSWMSITGNHKDDNILSNFYNNMTRWAYSMQNIVYLTRVNDLIISRNQAKDKKYIFSERSIFTDRHIFAEIAHKSNNMNELEWKWYLEWYSFLYKYFKTSIEPNGYIYLNCDVGVSMNRIKKRDRDGEDKIDVNYLKELCESHDLWMGQVKRSGKPVLILDCNNDFLENEEEMNKHIMSINNFIKNIK